MLPLLRARGHCGGRTDRPIARADPGQADGQRLRRIRPRSTPGLQVRDVKLAAGRVATYTAALLAGRPPRGSRRAGEGCGRDRGTHGPAVASRTFPGRDRRPLVPYCPSPDPHAPRPVSHFLVAQALTERRASTEGWVVRRVALAIAASGSIAGLLVATPGMLAADPSGVTLTPSDSIAVALHSPAAQGDPSAVGFLLASGSSEPGTIIVYLSAATAGDGTLALPVGDIKPEADAPCVVTAAEHRTPAGRTVDHVHGWGWSAVSAITVPARDGVRPTVAPGCHPARIVALALDGIHRPRRSLSIAVRTIESSSDRSRDGCLSSPLPGDRTVRHRESDRFDVSPSRGASLPRIAARSGGGVVRRLDRIGPDGTDRRRHQLAGGVPTIPQVPAHGNSPRRAR